MRRSTAGLHTKILICQWLKKYFENALDDAKIDYEKKMIIESHFVGTRAKHYTDRDVEELRSVYRSAYPFIRVSVDQHFSSERKTRLTTRGSAT